jgi:hypothetical protein
MCGSTLVCYLAPLLPWVFAETWRDSYGRLVLPLIRGHHGVASLQSSIEQAKKAFTLRDSDLLFEAISFAKGLNEDLSNIRDKMPGEDLARECGEWISTTEENVAEMDKRMFPPSEMVVVEPHSIPPGHA